MLSKTNALKKWWNTLSSAWQEILVEQIGAYDTWKNAPTRTFASVKELDCSYSGITTLQPLALFPNLQILDISGAEVQDFLPIAELNKLEELHACYCRPFDLRLLYAHDRLRILDLSYPHGKLVNTFVISDLVELEELFLNAGGMTSIADLMTLDKLSLTTLHFNPIPAEEVYAFAEIMQDCRVLF